MNASIKKAVGSRPIATIMKKKQPSDHVAGALEANIASNQGAQTEKLENIVLAIYRHKHILNNFPPKGPALDEMAFTRDAPKKAAVLARIWANEDFEGLDGRSQKEVGASINMDETSVSKIIGEFLIKPDPLVEIIPPPHQRSQKKTYKITESGKRELENWLKAYYGVYSLEDFSKDPRSIRMAEKYLNDLKALVAKGLGLGGPE